MTINLVDKITPSISSTIRSNEQKIQVEMLVVYLVLVKFLKNCKILQLYPDSIKFCMSKNGLKSVMLINKIALFRKIMHISCSINQSSQV